ncbi:ABC transporter permease [Viridibacillus sp. NPDC096237]|uniref:ABC transporter permease n=1 Tax=Viridibacillus sp. NPDC096237 TaxID=3390721 RepID=UPI003CFC8DB2
MIKLMKLEWKKNQLSGYLKGLIICIVGIFAAVSLMAWGSKVEDDLMFTDYVEFMSLANIFIRIVFIIFSSVILSRLVIEEYRNKTIQLLFSYPLKRKKLMQAKLSIVFVFCFFSIIISTFIISILVYFFNPTFGFFETPVSLSDMISTVPTTIISAFMIAGVSLIPLYFGMRKKSTATTITSAVLISFIINGNVSNGGSQVNLFQFIGVPITLCLLGLLIGYLSYHKVEKLDLA